MDIHAFTCGLKNKRLLGHTVQAALRNKVLFYCLVSLQLLFVLFYTSKAYASLIEQSEQHGSTSTSAVSFPTVDKNIPYKDVAKLAFRPADKIIPYGAKGIEDAGEPVHEDQYAALWFADKQSKAEIAVSTKPLLVFIHGGCWLSAFDMAHSYPMTTGLQQAGYNVLSLEYRRAGNGGEWPVALDDLGAALKTSLTAISENENDLASQVNTQHIVLIGHSAGGHLAAMLALTLEDILPASVERVDMLSLAGIMDIKQYAQGSNSCQSATPSFMQGLPDEQPQSYYLANPQSYSIEHPKLKHFILLQGSADNIVPVTQAMHASAQRIVLNGVGHFDWIHPGSFAFKHLLSELKKTQKSQ